MEQDDKALFDAVTALRTLDLTGLRSAWPERFGTPPRLRSPDLLRRQLAWRLQVEAQGGLDVVTRTELAKPASSPSRSVQPVVGARLVREWQGQRHEVEITRDGVLYRGSAFASLSQVARAITGVRWNGPRFFGLRGGA